MVRLNLSSKLDPKEGVLVRFLGSQDYEHVWQTMQDFTNYRNADTIDEIWVLQHAPVFTQGQAGKAEHDS